MYYCTCWGLPKFPVEHLHRGTSLLMTLPSIPLVPALLCHHLLPAEAHGGCQQVTHLLPHLRNLPRQQCDPCSQRTAEVYFKEQSPSGWEPTNLLPWSCCWQVQICPAAPQVFCKVILCWEKGRGHPATALCSLLLQVACYKPGVPGQWHRAVCRPLCSHGQDTAQPRNCWLLPFLCSPGNPVWK